MNLCWLYWLCTRDVLSPSSWTVRQGARVRLAVVSGCAVLPCAVVFWGNPLWQVYHALRTHACTVTVKGLRPATPAEITRMHNDCAICWCPMTVTGAQGRAASEAPQPESSSHRDRDPQPHSGTASDAGSPASAAHGPEGSHHAGSSGDGTPLVPPAEATTTDAAATAAANQLAAGPAGAAETADSGAGAVVVRQLPGLPESDGSTLPCGHSFHQGCLTQVGGAGS